jgi:hypothetical protein
VFVLAPGAPSAALFHDPETLFEDHRTFRREMRGMGLDLSSCPTRLADLRFGLFGGTVAAPSAARALREIFQSRLALKEAFDRLFTPETDPSSSEVRLCADALRRTLVEARFTEDFLLELAGVDHPILLTHPRFPTLRLRPGDVLLLRFPSFPSAIVAQAGTVPAQFSHLAIVHITEAGETFAIDSALEVGLRALPVARIFPGTNARAAVFRFADEGLAARAAAILYAQTSGPEHEIPKYDLSMDLADHSRVFCAEAVSMAFEAASGGTVCLPMFQTQFSPAIRSRAAAFGIGVTRTFAPADVEVDPRFTLVAEWRDPAAIPDLLDRDAIVARLLTWMEEESYALRPRPLSRAAAGTIVALRRERISDLLLLPALLKIPLRRKIPAHVDSRAVGQFLAFNGVTKRMKAELGAAAAQHRARAGLPMTYAERLEVLDAIRDADAARYAVRKPAFHDEFRPPGHPQLAAMIVTAP